MESRFHKSVSSLLRGGNIGTLSRTEQKVRKVHIDEQQEHRPTVKRVMEEYPATMPPSVVFGTEYSTLFIAATSTNSETGGAGMLSCLPI